MSRQTIIIICRINKKHSFTSIDEWCITCTFLSTVLYYSVSFSGKGIKSERSDHRLRHGISMSFRDLGPLATFPQSLFFLFIYFLSPILDRETSDNNNSDLRIFLISVTSLFRKLWSKVMKIKNWVKEFFTFLCLECPFFFV